MTPKEYAAITPAVLKWARETAGYTVDDVALKVGVARGRVLGWESGMTLITVGRLDLLANIYKRPTALFYMPAPPKEEEEVGPKDFRDAPTKLSPELIFQIRRARERRETALDLCDEIGERAAQFEFRCRDDERPHDAGARLRELLGVSAEEQKSWSTDRRFYLAFNAWKEAAEENGVLIFQTSEKNMAGARGFSLHGAPLSVVVLSSDSAVAGRIFTLFHELAHLGLREGGLCDLHDDGVEYFCNKVAAAALMPEQQLREHLEPLRSFSRSGSWNDTALRSLAGAFSVSEQALVLRLVDLGEATIGFYRSKLPEFRARAAQAKKQDSASIPPHVIAIARNGREFTRLVIEAYHRGAITEHRASNYLHLSHEHLPRLIDEMAHRAIKRAS